MIYAINYADDKYKKAQKLNSKTAILHGVDKVYEYSPEDIDHFFYDSNKEILDCQRGNGYWLWKPYFIKRTLDVMEDNDYLIYADSGAYYINNVNFLVECMEKEKTDIMVFLDPGKWLEREWSKRDAFILLKCDSKEYADTFQRCGGFIVVKKTEFVYKFVDEWLGFAQDERIITDQPNSMGKENYIGFRRNRHDQTILSLLSKKYAIKCFKSPYTYLHRTDADIEKEIVERSSYPDIFYLHRYGDVSTIEDLKQKYRKQLKKLLRFWDNNKKILLYGAGVNANKIMLYVESENKKIDACVVSDDQVVGGVLKHRVKIYHFSELPYSVEESIVIVTIQSSEVLLRLEKAGFSYYCVEVPDWIALHFLYKF